MSNCRSLRLASFGVTLLWNCPAQPQVPFDLDTTFATAISRVYVASLVPLQNGDILVAGRFQHPESSTLLGVGRLTSEGLWDLSFDASNLGSGKIVPWNERIYVGTTQTVRRLMPTGVADPEFISMNLGAYFSSLQGGDYHVYPDGRVLMSGAHVLSDSIRGFEGLYSLIWFTNTGYLDTTRTHRLCNGVIYAIEEQPDGKFLCTGTMTTYEGQPVNTVFRVLADGALDTTFEAPLQWYGEARDYHTLQDGRILVSGPLKLIGSEDIQGVIRLLSDGSLDPSFNLLDFDATFTPSQIPSVSSILQLSPDRFIITGVFDKINGVDRGGIAMIDSSGALVEDVFDGLGCGEYEYAVSSGSTTYKYIAGIVPTQDGSFYIHGGYHGYDDGSTNDTTQRMVSRLYGLEVGVREQEYSTVLSLFPNPSDGPLRIASSGLNWLGAGITVFDPQGRKVAEGTLLEESPELDLRDLPSGCYVVQVTTTQGQRLMAKWTRE